nr:hypothetical protein [Conexibacter sp. W3-3-2]
MTRRLVGRWVLAEERDGLRQQLEALLADGATQAREPVGAVGDPRAVHVIGRVDDDPVLARVLGLVHGQVRLDQQLVRIDPTVTPRDRHADRCSHLQPATVDLENACATDDRRQLARNGPAAGDRGSGKDERELVSADARKHVCRSHRLAESGRDANEQFVSRRVSEEVVDSLEPVEVQQQETARPAVADDALNLPTQFGVEAAAPEEIGQRIVVCEVAEPHLHVPAHGDVHRLEEQQRPPVGVEDTDAGDEGPDRTTVSVTQSQLSRRAPPGGDLGDDPRVGRLVLREEERGLGPSQDAFGSATDHRREGRVALQDIGRPVVPKPADQHPGGGCLEPDGEQLVRGGELSQCPIPCRDVE